MNALTAWVHELDDTEGEVSTSDELGHVDDFKSWAWERGTGDQDDWQYARIHYDVEVKS